ncbi:MAG: hypothetical protein R6V44_15640, partial [Paracoccaceae bacterium]
MPEEVPPGPSHAADDAAQAGLEGIGRFGHEAGAAAPLLMEPGRRFAEGVPDGFREARERPVATGRHPLEMKAGVGRRLLMRGAQLLVAGLLDHRALPVGESASPVGAPAGGEAAAGRGHAGEMAAGHDRVG